MTDREYRDFDSAKYSEIDEAHSAQLHVWMFVGLDGKPITLSAVDDYDIEYHYDKRGEIRLNGTLVGHTEYEQRLLENKNND